MKLVIARSLLKDALYQVLDNMVFRILAVLIVLFVLPFFLIGFREKEIVVVYAWRFEYTDWMRQIASYFGSDDQSGMVNWVQATFIDTLAGGVGMLFCIVATSFFMPRMLEKGYADTVFSKPVSRTALMLSRYVAGILFVGLLSIVLVGGQFLGLRLVSGYSDPGFLFSVFTLIWLFMMLHAVSLLAGIYTRSAIAAVMLVILFYASTGGVHWGWRLTEKWRADHARKVEAMAKAGKDTGDENPGWFGSTALGAIDALHYFLPKTSDSELIAKLFRRQFEIASRELDDEETGISILRPPKGYTREPRSSLKVADGLLWIAPHPSGGGEAHWSLKRQPVGESKSRSTLAKEFKKDISSQPAVSDVTNERAGLGRTTAERIEWHEKGGSEERVRSRWFFQSSDWMLTLDYDAEATWSETDGEKRSHERFLAGITVGGDDPRDALEDPHTRQFGWSAELRHNAWFSIATTAAFIVLTLALSWWKLSRIDF